MIKFTNFIRICLAAICVIYCSIKAINAETFQSHQETKAVNQPVYTECGGVIPVIWQEVEYAQRIAYKHDTNYTDDEFCVWTLLGDDSITSITLRFTFGTMGLGDGLVVYTYDNLELNSQSIPNIDDTITFNASMLTIAFSSDYYSNGNGFIILIATSTGYGATGKRAFMVNQDGGSLSYPNIKGEEQYGTDEHTSIVLHPPPQTPRRFYEYKLTNLDVESNHDFVVAYILLSYLTINEPHFVKIGTFSGKLSGTVKNSTIITPFPVLYIFSSDRKVSGNGFTIEWELHQNKIQTTNTCRNFK